VDITEVILADHHEQRRLFATLDEMHDCEAEQVGPVWERLHILLEVHARAEELIFYPVLARLGSSASDEPAEETEDAVHDHNEIRDALSEVGEHGVGSERWWAAVAKVNEVNSDHMGEEEREGLTTFRKEVGLDVRHSMGIEFYVFEARHAKGIRPRDLDPESYVEEARDR
jgi:hypothetical protein